MNSVPAVEVDTNGAAAAPVAKVIGSYSLADFSSARERAQEAPELVQGALSGSASPFVRFDNRRHKAVPLKRSH